MTYIEQFLSQHILSYYLSSLRASADHRLFVDHHNQRNFFSLTWEILLFGDNMAKCKSRDWLIDLVRGNLIISYDDLKDVTLPQKEHDSDSIRYIKTKFEYVYVQMHQIMIRMILAHLIIAKEETLSKEIQKLIKEIGYIYPALKAEISINCSGINLADWFQHYLTQLIEEKHPKQPFFQFLEEVKNECNMLGPIERLFERLVKSYQQEEQSKKEKEQSCLFEESRSQSMFKLSQNQVFNDHEMLRKKKKITKQRLKHQNYETNSYVTPLKAKQQFIPQTQKTELWRTQQNCESSHSHSNTSSSAFSKLLKKYKKPLVRTIYHGSTKTFVSKRQNGAELSSEHFIESLTATTSLTNESILLYDMNRRYSTKLTKSSFDSEDKSEFCVPETPKQDALRKLSTEKKILFESNPLPRLKI